MKLHGPTQDSPRFGFTLIELMVVLVLIGIATAMILPEMKGTYEDALLRAAGRNLVNACNLANSRAITINQLHRVRLDRRNGRYFVERTARDGEGRSGFVPLRDVSGSEGGIDARISVELRKPGEEGTDGPDQEPAFASGDDPQTSDRDEAISFYPDGTADTAEIHLRDRAGFRLVLRISPVTARVQIAEGERQ